MPPDTLEQAGYDPSRHRAQQYDDSWAAEDDLVLAMDHTNLADLGGRTDRVALFRDFDPSGEGEDVPDPYYGGEDGFRDVLTIVERTADAAGRPAVDGARLPTALIPVVRPTSTSTGRSGGRPHHPIRSSAPQAPLPAAQADDPRGRGDRIPEGGTGHPRPYYRGARRIRGGAVAVRTSPWSVATDDDGARG